MIDSLLRSVSSEIGGDWGGGGGGGGSLILQKWVELCRRPSTHSLQKN